MYELSVIAMFKNESWIIKEWIEHYLTEGVEHFYLIDNGSTDDFRNKIKDYMNKITLVTDPTRMPYGTQSFLYQKIFLDKIKKETKWIITCDIDEYIYTRNGYKNIIDVLNNLPSIVETVWIPWKIFGSNGNITHPNSIVYNFNKRSNESDKFLGHGKSIFQTKNLVNFGCCGHYVEIKNNSRIHTPNGDYYYTFDMNEENFNNFNLHLNHYMFLSEEYYLNIKCSRGGGESGLTSKYSIDYFRENDKKHNTIIDNELIEKKNAYKYLINKYSLQFTKNDTILFNKYLDISTNYLQISENNSEKLLFQTILKKNLENIISIENNYHRFNKINNLMINNNKFIHLFNKENNNHWIKLLNKNILNKLDLIYIDVKIDHKLYKIISKIISKKCYIIINNNRKYKLFKNNFNIINKLNYNELIILQKIQ
jgi:hypothetical protein